MSGIITVRSARGLLLQHNFMSMQLQQLPYFLVLSALLLFTGCKKEDDYDDNQYGNTCLVEKFRIVTNNMTTTFEYYPDDFISSVTMQAPSMPTMRMQVTYNNQTAFADFYMGDKKVGSTEAPLDSLGYILSTTNVDSNGTDLGTEQYTYDADHNLTHVGGFYFFDQSNQSVDIEWENGNPVRFHTNQGVVRCAYRSEPASSIYLGRGNVTLLAQRACANIATCYSRYLIKTYDLDGVELNGQSMHAEYDFDSDNKVRKIFWSSTSSGNKGETQVSYFCY